MHRARHTAILGPLLFVAATTALAETIEIDAPGILDEPGATYVLTRDVTVERTAFMVKDDHITLDLGGHTIIYGTAVGVDRCRGVFLRPGGSEGPFKGVPKEGFGGGNRFTLRGCAHSYSPYTPVISHRRRLSRLGSPSSSSRLMDFALS